MKQYFRMVALVLCVSLLLPILGGCGMFGGYEEPEVFDPRHLSACCPICNRAVKLGVTEEEWENY